MREGCGWSEAGIRSAIRQGCASSLVQGLEIFIKSRPLFVLSFIIKYKIVLCSENDDGTNCGVSLESEIMRFQSTHSLQSVHHFLLC